MRSLLPRKIAAPSSRDAEEGALLSELGRPNYMS